MRPVDFSELDLGGVEAAVTTELMTATFRLTGEHVTRLDDIPGPLFNPVNIPPAVYREAIVQQYLYIITTDEKLLMMHLGFHRPRLTHAQLLHHTSDKRMRIAGFINFNFSEQTWIADNSSGHFKPYVDKNTAEYVISILKQNGFENAQFQAEPGSKKVDGINPSHFAGYEKSYVVSVIHEESSSQLSDKLSIQTTQNQCEIKTREKG